MSLNNLRSYNWEQGTLSNPVSLTGTQFSWLINLLKKGTITKDIRGYIQVGSPITSYEKYLVELAKDEHNQPLLHLVNPTVTPVEYTVVPQASTIKEGTSTKLNINGIGLEALKFRIVNHTNDTPDYQARTTIDTKLGYVRVASAQENTTWTDVVTIQTCPVWEEWSDPNASIVEFDVTVNAISVSSVTITAPQYVKPTETFYPIVNFLPVNHTKPIVNTLEDAGAKRGICFIPTSDDFSVGKTTDPTKMSAIAPSTETPVGETWSLGCGVYAFTSSQTMATPSVNVAVKYPYIQFTVTTDGTFRDISTANPKITLQKVDSQDTPIGEPVVLTGTVSGSSLVYTYGGGAIAGDGSETYQVSIENVHGYSTPNIADIVPNGVITEIGASYSVIQPDVYIVYTDGTEQSFTDFSNNGYTIISGKTPIGILLNTVDDKILIALDDDSAYIPWGNIIVNEIPGVPHNSGVESYKNGYLYTTLIIAEGNNEGLGDVYSAKYCREKSLTINGNVCEGYLMAPGEYLLLYWNGAKINQIQSILNFKITSFTNDDVNYFVAATVSNGRAYYCGNSSRVKGTSIRSNNYIDGNPDKFITTKPLYKYYK